MVCEVRIRDCRSVKVIDNFVEFAMHSYHSPHTTIEEFREDCNRFTELNKLFGKYVRNDDLKIRMIVNHIVILYNVFDAEACTKMLFYKLKKEYWSGLKTVLTYLNYMPESFDNRYNSDIPVDMVVAAELRAL